MSCLDRKECFAVVRDTGSLQHLPETCPPICFVPGRVPRYPGRDLTEFSEGCKERVDCCGRVFYDERSKGCSGEIEGEICDGSKHPKYKKYKCKYCIKLKLSGEDKYSPKMQMASGSVWKFRIKGMSGEGFGVYSSASMSGKCYSKYDDKEGCYVATMPKSGKVYYGCPGRSSSGNYIVIA